MNGNFVLAKLIFLSKFIDYQLICGIWQNIKTKA
jgi:hypothetical protein